MENSHCLFQQEHDQSPPKPLCAFASGDASRKFLRPLNTSIIPIIVTYNPEKEILLTSLRVLLAQVKTVIVVDNGSNSSIDSILHALSNDEINHIRVLALEHNYGLGKAYNIGISLARSLNAVFVLLMDHDSIPETNMLHELHSAFIDLEKQGKLVCAVGPRYRDYVSSQLSQFVVIGQSGLTRSLCDQSTHYVRADFIISSGSLISVRSLDQIGNMDEDLFIDHIDTEWCFRAKFKGFGIYGVCDAIMQHSLGERQTRIWWGRWRSVSSHQPFRYYYMFRNSILLWQRPYMPDAWKRADRLRMFYFLFFLIAVAPNKIANLRMMFKGLKDGLSKRSGKL